MLLSIFNLNGSSYILIKWNKWYVRRKNEPRKHNKKQPRYFDKKKTGIENFHQVVNEKAYEVEIPWSVESKLLFHINTAKSEIWNQ